MYSKFIKVKVTTNSKKEEVIQKSADSFQVKVRAKPIQGQANIAVTKALASFLKIPENKLQLVRGSKARNKIFTLNRTCSGSGFETNPAPRTKEKGEVLRGAG